MTPSRHPITRHSGDAGSGHGRPRFEERGKPEPSDFITSYPLVIPGPAKPEPGIQLLCWVCLCGESHWVPGSLLRSAPE
jgi:hypothetical protein